MSIYLYIHTYVHTQMKAIQLWTTLVLNYWWERAGWVYQWLLKLLLLNSYLQEIQPLTQQDGGFLPFLGQCFCSPQTATELLMFWQFLGIARPDPTVTQRGSAAACFTEVNIKLLDIVVFIRQNTSTELQLIWFFIPLLLRLPACQRESLVINREHYTVLEKFLYWFVKGEPSPIFS